MEKIDKLKKVEKGCLAIIFHTQPKYYHLVGKPVIVDKFLGKIENRFKHNDFWRVRLDDPMINMVEVSEKFLLRIDDL